MTKAAFAVLCAVVLSPTLLVDIPAMGDYLNHLARMHILSAAGTTAANPFYEVKWGPYPYLAMDLLVPALASVLGVEAATKSFLLLSQVLIVTGAMMLEGVVKGRQQFAGLSALALLYSLPFAWGFLNFEFGMGVALWGISAWLLIRDRSQILQLFAHSLFATVVYASHFLAFGIYGAVIGLYELWRFNQGRNVKKAAITLAILANPLVLLLIAFGLDAAGSYRSEWIFAGKLYSIFHAMSGYNRVLSALAMALVIAAAYVMCRRGNLKIVHAGTWIAVGLALIFLAMPFRVSGSAFADVRVLVAAGLVLPAFITIEPASVNLGARCAIALFALVNAAHVASIWVSYKGEYTRIKASFGLIERHSKVLVGHSGDGKDPPSDLGELPIHHAPVLAVGFASALVPSLAAFAGILPVQMRTSFKDFGVVEPGYESPVPLPLLRAIADGLDTDAIPQHARAWHRRYQYLYLVGPRIPNPMPGRLQELSGGNRFALYRIATTPPDHVHETTSKD